ncbi:DUF4465 domain-containing protein [Bacteroidota bacterium]
MKSILSIFIILFIVFIVGCSDEDTFKSDYAEFEDIYLEKNTFWNGSDGTGQFFYGNKIFSNTFHTDWNTWSGFAYSNVINYLYYNESAKYASYPSGGADESENYVVAHQFEKIVIDFEKGEDPRWVQITNATYTALAIKYGYGYAKQFGGRDGSDPDWFKLTITGIGLVDQITGTVDFFLADFRFDDDTKDFIIDKWEFVDLTALGEVKRLEFELSSSDAGTPLYFCLDNLNGRVHF